MWVAGDGKSLRACKALEKTLKTKDPKDLFLLTGGICTYGLTCPIFDAAVLTDSLSMSIWFATDR